MEDKDLERLGRTVKTGVPPYHCILDNERWLKEAGLEESGLGDVWRVVVGGNYYVKVFNSSLVAFMVGENLAEVSSLRMAASHTDWPYLKLKPSPEVNISQYGKSNIEVYGGAIYGTWLDRLLSMAGKVCMAGENPFEPVMRYMDMKQPLAIVPNLAIHTNREVNESVKLNVQVDMLPMPIMLTEDLGRGNYFLNLLAKEAECLPEEILGYDTCLYNLDDCTTLGFHEDSFNAPRLDNTTLMQACLTGILEGKWDSDTNMTVLCDSGEVGSCTKQGALSSVTERMLEELYLPLGYTREEFLNGLLNGSLLSMGMAHTLHPNHVGRCDTKDQALLGDGVAIKTTAGQSYITDVAAISVIEGIYRTYETPYKKFSNRSDMRSSSMLGTSSPSLLFMKTVDVGMPILAIHSARELMESKDQAALVALCTNFFQAF